MTQSKFFKITLKCLLLFHNKAKSYSCIIRYQSVGIPQEIFKIIIINNVVLYTKVFRSIIFAFTSVLIVFNIILNHMSCVQLLSVQHIYILMENLLYWNIFILVILLLQFYAYLKNRFMFLEHCELICIKLKNSNLPFF